MNTKFFISLQLFTGPLAWEIGVQSQPESYQRYKKWYLMPPCLTLSNIRFISRVKWSNPRKGVTPFSTPQCNSYYKGSFRVAFDYSRQLYLLYNYSEFIPQWVLNAVVLMPDFVNFSKY